MSELFDDEPPYIGPEIQNEYENLLGAFLVRFNRIENLLNSILKQVLTLENAEHLYNRNSMFSEKVLHLEFLSLTVTGKKALGIPFNELRSLNGKRNVVAHGHFDQNPFDGDYVIVHKDDGRQINSNDLKSYCRKADEIWEKIRASDTRLCFLDAVSILS